MRLCIKCGFREAVLPDRERFPSRVKRICRECHADRLISDFEAVLREKAKDGRIEESMKR